MIAEKESKVRDGTKCGGHGFNLRAGLGLREAKNRPNKGTHVLPLNITLDWAGARSDRTVHPLQGDALHDHDFQGAKTTTN
jgi:hypothetical protein